MLPITWNNETSEWDVKDQTGKVLHSEESYADAAEWADNYLKQASMKDAIVGSSRG